jgi:hypothetical protein
MRGNLVALAVGASLLALAPSEASAYVCKAVGLGWSGVGRGSYIERAKLIALHRCENNAGLHLCTILYCRP